MDSEQRLNCVWLVSLVLTGLVMFFLASSELLGFNLSDGMKIAMSGFNFAALLTFVYASLKKI